MEFITDITPFKKNMEAFGEEWGFTFGDGKKGTPKMCIYEKYKNVYMDDNVVEALTERMAKKLDTTSKVQAGELFKYIKKNFMDGLD